MFRSLVASGPRGRRRRHRLCFRRKGVVILLTNLYAKFRGIIVFDIVLSHLIYRFGSISMRHDDLRTSTIPTNNQFILRTYHIFVAVVVVLSSSSGLCVILSKHREDLFLARRLSICHLSLQMTQAFYDYLHSFVAWLLTIFRCLSDRKRERDIRVLCGENNDSILSLLLLAADQRS